MEFKLTEDTLQRLEKKENITVRDIMGFVVQDICSDLQKGCGELTRLNLGNDEQEEEDAILFICNLARKLAKIQSRNQAKFDEPDYRPVWNGADRKLQEAMTQLEALEEEITRKQEILAQLEETTRNLGDNREKIAEYERLTEEKENALRLSQGIEEKCQNLKEEIAEIKEQKIPEWEQKKKELEADLWNARQELEARKQEMQPYTRELDARNQDLEELKDTARYLEDRKQKLVQEKESVQQQSEEAEQEIRQMEVKITEIQQKIKESEKLITDKKDEYAWQCEEQKHVDRKLEELEGTFGDSMTEVRSKQAKLKEIYELFSKDPVLQGEWMFDRNRVGELQKYLQNNLAQTEESIKESRRIYEKILKYMENGGNENEMSDM